MPDSGMIEDAKLFLVPQLDNGPLAPSSANLKGQLTLTEQTDEPMWNSESFLADKGLVPEAWCICPIQNTARIRFLTKTRTGIE